jgi:hypothetical protein
MDDTFSFDHTFAATGHKASAITSARRSRERIGNAIVCVVRTRHNDLRAKVFHEIWAAFLRDKHTQRIATIKQSFACDLENEKVGR